MNYSGKTIEYFIDNSKFDWFSIDGVFYDPLFFDKDTYKSLLRMVIKEFWTKIDSFGSGIHLKTY